MNSYYSVNRGVYKEGHIFSIYQKNGEEGTAPYLFSWGMEEREQLSIQWRNKGEATAPGTTKRGRRGNSSMDSKAMEQHSLFQ